ncbi:MAG: hypothetical protein V1917_01940 [Candidatus Gottesmanbacteria bacterium]
MKEKKDNTIIYIISTISFILMGIVLTGIIDKTKSSDIRTRASTTSGISATAVVSDIKYDTGTIIIDQLIFASSPEKGLGSWIVTPPSGFKLDSINIGSSIKLMIEPSTFAITSHSLTAKEIKKK